MTPSLPSILLGQVIALSAPAPPEAGGDYAAGRVGLVATLLLLASQEAERGPAAAAWENEAMRALFADAAADYDLELGDELTADAATWTEVDAVNDALRRRLVVLHAATEARRDAPLQQRILNLYVAMANSRRLDLPGAGG